MNTLCQKFFGLTVVKMFDDGKFARRARRPGLKPPVAAPSA